MALAIGALAAGVSLAAPAQAYVRYRLASGVPEEWKETCIPLVVYPNDLANEMTADEVEQATSAAAAAWSSTSIDGTYIDVQVTASMDATPMTGSDKFHDVVFKNPWCDPGDTTCQVEALAITSVWAGQTSGTIVDADIEVNAQYAIWTDYVNNPSPAKQDLQNALTHEMGHLIGLDHNCYTPGSDPVRMTDNTGALVPPCLGASTDIMNDVMYTKADPGDVSKRTLKPDDIQAVLDIYPTSQDPHLCLGAGEVVSLSTPASGCRCAVDSSSSASAAVLPTLALLAALVGRRRRRQP